MTGFVYAIEGHGAIKIGFAKNPARRLSELNVGSSQSHRLLGYARGTKRHETELHGLCRSKRIRGEWFRNEGVVSLFIAHLPEYHPPAPRQPLRHSNPPPVKTEASSLSFYMAAQSLSDRDMAVLIGGCQESAVRKWRTGARIPRRKSLKRILEITEGAVTPADFLLGPAA